MDSSDPSVALRTALLDLALDHWRLTKLFGRLLQRLDAGEAQRYVNQLRFSRRRTDQLLEAHNLRMVDLEGHPFEPGMAATAVNQGDFGGDDQLIVDQMIEPIVMGSDGVVRPGTVLLKKR